MLSSLGGGPLANDGLDSNDCPSGPFASQAGRLHRQPASILCSERPAGPPAPPTRMPHIPACLTQRGHFW
eukprot:jgi/Mesvir1/6180/Mv25362-RA.1